MNEADGNRKIVELVDQASSCMLTTMTAEGRHVSRPMAVQDVEFDGDLWFFAYEDSAKVAQFRRQPQVNVAFSDDKHASWTSLSGRAEIVHDRARAEELWTAPLKTWFPDGVDTEGLTLIRVQVETAEYWDASTSRAKRLIGSVAAAVTRTPDRFPAENETVHLD